MFLVLVAGGATYYAVHLEQVPETGRWRFMDVSPDMEKEMGAQGLQEVMGEYGGKVLPDYHPTARHVQSVVKRLIRANGLEDKLGGDKEGWKTHVVKEDGTKKCVAALFLTPVATAGRKLTLCLPHSAFVLPNGSIFVFTGILSVANDEDSLACVLGHGPSSPPQPSPCAGRSLCIAAHRDRPSSRTALSRAHERHEGASPSACISALILTHSPRTCRSSTGSRSSCQAWASTRA